MVTIRVFLASELFCTSNPPVKNFADEEIEIVAVIPTTVTSPIRML